MSDLKIGFTGSQKGMTSRQVSVITRILTVLKPDGVSHGDCIGADAQFDEIAASLGIYRWVRPGCDPYGRSPKRACCKGEFIYAPAAYLHRNLEIVVTTDIMIAAPFEMEEQVRSGTWSTIRQARRRNKPLFLVQPIGHFVQHPVGGTL